MNASPSPESEPPESPPTPPDVLFLTVAVEGGAALLALAVGYYRADSPWHMIRWSFPAVLLALLATLPAVAVGLLLLKFPFGPLKKLKQTVERLVQELLSGAQWHHLAFIAALAGFGEELLFRGTLQKIIAEHYGAPAGLLLSSVAFGLAHALSKTYFALATLMGLYFGWLWIASDYNLLVPIIVHALYDFVVLMAIVRGHGQGAEENVSRRS